MKIKLSKSQWNDIGKKAGWLKTAQNEYPKKCPKCNGNKFISEKIKNLGTQEYRDNTETCDFCKGKGSITKEDYDRENNRYLHNMGVSEDCPHCKK